MEDTDYNRPRRPNPDTLTYLKSLPFDERIAHQEISSYLNYQKKIKQEGYTEENLEEFEEEVEYPQILSAALAALDEIKNEIASLAGDEFGSQCIETIARITAPYSTNAARQLLYGVSGYMIHLSTHRYGSHVVQTILQSILHYDGLEVSKILEIDEEEQNAENGDELPILKDLILSVSEEVLPVCKDLAVHICGSHVLRTLLSILGGCAESIPHHLANKGGAGGVMQSGGTRRGKVKSKKKKKKNKSVMMADGISNSASFARYERVENPRVNSTDADIQNTLYSFIYKLTQLDLNKTDDKESYSSQPGELQQLACHPSAGPLLTVLLRILINHSNTKNKDSAASKKPMIDQDEANKSISDYRLGIHAPESQFIEGSHAETFVRCLLCWENESNADQKQEKAGDIIYGLSGESRGSHLIETILRTSNDSFYEAFCNAGKFFQADSFADYSRHEVCNFVIQTLLNTARTKEQVEKLISCTEGLINDGYVLDKKNKRRGIFFRLVEMAAKYRIGQETILKCMQKGFGALKVDGPLTIEECIPKLIDFHQPEEGKRFAELDATGARTVYQLLRFVPRLCGGVLNSIVSKYDVSQLLSMCNDGLASTCIIDGILNGPTKQGSFAKAVEKLFEKLRGEYVALSVERIGHHTVNKIFIKLGKTEHRFSLSEELANGINRLNGNAMGRSVIMDCAVKDFMEGEELWSATVKKRLEREDFLKDIVEGNLGTPGTGTEKKRKRKRKKGASKEAPQSQDEIKEATESKKMKA
jgi:hypothetical protein